MTYPTGLQNPHHPGGSPALSPDGRWWWDGAQWQPVAAHGARGPRSGPSTGKIVAIVLACAVGVPIVLGILAAVAIPVFLNQRDKAVDAELHAVLQSAMIAQETVRVAQGTYTDDPAALAAAGFEAGTETYTWVRSATTDTYCIAAGAGDEEPTHWATPAGVSDQPC
ncbi:type IV pilin protein [Cellulomonas sp. NPDC055163]